METIYIVLCIVGVVLLSLIVWKVFFPAKDDTSGTNSINQLATELATELARIAKAAADASAKPTTAKFENTDCSNYIPISKKNIEDNKYCFFKYVGNNIYLVPELTILYEQLYNKYSIKGDLQNNITNLSAKSIKSLFSEGLVLLYIIINKNIIEFIKSIYLSGLVLSLQIDSFLMEGENEQIYTEIQCPSDYATRPGGSKNTCWNYKEGTNVIKPRTVLLRYYKTSNDIPSGITDVTPNTLYIKYFDGIIADEKERNDKKNSINNTNTDDRSGQPLMDSTKGIRINLDIMIESMKKQLDYLNEINTTLNTRSKEVKEEISKLTIMYMFKNSRPSNFYNFNQTDLDNDIETTKIKIKNLDTSIKDELVSPGLGLTRNKLT